MKKCPKPGTRVSASESLTYGAFTGTVLRVYRTYVWDEIRDRETTVPLPEDEWHVCVKVDAVPAKWPYPGTDLIAPRVCDLRRFAR